MTGLTPQRDQTEAGWRVSESSSSLPFTLSLIIATFCAPQNPLLALQVAGCRLLSVSWYILIWKSNLFFLKCSVFFLSF